MTKLKIGCLQFMIMVSSVLWAQDFDHQYGRLSSGNELKDKLFYLFSIIQQLDLREDISMEPYREVYQKKRRALEQLSNDEKLSQHLADLKFSDIEITILKDEFQKLSEGHARWEDLINTHLIPSGYNIKIASTDNSEFLSETLENSLNGINLIIDTYGLGIHGKYASIDSVRFDVNGQEYAGLIKNRATVILQRESQKGLFFEPSLETALSLLELNERTDAARFEPMDEGVNRAAIDAVQTTNWAKYPYSVILVPGNGPKGTERLSENAKKRLKSAVDNYNRKLAPFIVVSGGSVHPPGTKINEAEEMKRELMTRYKIPESTIIMDPHARHTPTNLRNCNRLVLRYGFPKGKKILITTDKKQADKISHRDFVNRSREELGHEPFLLLNKISDIEIEYYPVLLSLPIDLIDPLDP
ncbi:YdcF family protein [Sphingobacterium haloxyli]|uniref:DUF218 domain-containing protein n=1 Tax=Sphingobacterium haloxyli TaxID=2100533 RepID=A0A2S9J4R6_9SPHI|nr:YdcF family protein [Sphingobacterium haloxyli]PRD47781.1 hypothetical protein C5745_07650 [Sphingobacterium haloxyli]